MRKKEKKIEELKEILKVDPASDACVELARILIEDQETRPEAREVLYAGLARNPHHSLARLLLARAFYLDDLLEFSVRELVELRKYTEVPSLAKLLDAFGSYASSYITDASPKHESPSEEALVEESGDVADVEIEEDVLAEIDIDDDFLEALSEIEEE